MSKPRFAVDGCTPILPPGAAPEPSELHPPLAGCDPVPIGDLAYAKLTRQSSIVAEPSSGWMFATEAEAEPWWEIDLSGFAFIERVTLWIAKAPPDTEVLVAAHAIHTPRGEPAAGCFQRRERFADLPVAVDGSAVLQVAPDTVARHVRITLRRAGGRPVALLVRGAEILGTPLFADSLLASYARAFTLFADRPLFAARATPGQGPFLVTHRYRDVWQAARRLAAALASILEPGSGEDRLFLGLCARNRPEWVMGDLAALMRGYVVVPLSPDDSDDRLAGVLARCPLSAVIVEGDGDRFARLAARCPSLRLVVTCDAPGDGPSRASFADLVARGAGVVPPPAEPREPRDLYSLLFTSGSSGVPKGAMRSYATFHAMLATYGIAHPAIHLSFQPLSHLSERMYLPTVILHGGLVGFSGGGAHLLSDLRALEPSVVGSVPRLFEIVHAAHQRRLAAALAAEPDAPQEEIEARVLAESRAVFGSRLQGIGVGSAPVAPEVLAFLRRCFADLWVSDGYGSTECGTITTDGHVRPHVEVKLVPVDGICEGSAERGEIWVRTPHLIDGYYGDPESTAASLDPEGYFRTGDLGERTEDGRVRVVGRVTNVIKLAQGEFVAVDRVEAELAGCPLVDQIFVHPDAASSGLLAVVVPHFGPLARALGVPDLPPREIANHPDAAAAILRSLAEHGRRVGLASFELPRAVLVEPEPLTVASGLLTASGKLARPAAIARYAAQLAALAQGAPPPAAGDSLAERLAAVVSGVIGRRVDPEEPLHQGLGVDSLTVAEVLSAARSTIGREIPLALWFEARTIAYLARRLDDGLLGHRAVSNEQPRRDLDIHPMPRDGDRCAARVPFQTILLTGASGLLGAHLLESLTARTTARVLCLVRAPSDEVAAARVREALARYAVPTPDPSRWTACAADLAAPDLGLSPSRWGEIASEVDAVLHAGAAVNWLHPYEALRGPNVLGTIELLSLAMTGRPKPFHFVSTISAAPADGDESSQLSFEQARSGGGYGLSKWVAEQLVRRAGERGHPIAVYRPSMITGHSRRGRGNPDDYVHRYLRACAASGRYLDAASERIDMTPVDFVADGIVALLTAHPDGGATHHLSNLDQSMTYADLGQAMARAGVPCSPSGYAEFRGLATSPGSPLRPLSSFFPEAGFALHMGPWPSTRTRAALAALGVVCPPVDDRLIATYLKGLAKRGEDNC